MDSFSWSDSLRAAFISCLPCFGGTAELDPPPHIDNPVRDRSYRAHSDELEGLLQDAETDTEAETLSLHSNFGTERHHGRRNRRGMKRITLFGWTLFGRPPIHLPDDDEEDGLLRRRRRLATTSSSTLDSDAAPLDSSAIASLSSAELAARAVAIEEEERRRKEERKAKRRELKERKRALMTLTLEDGTGEDFQGFQGSGIGPSLPTEDYGPFVKGQSAGRIDDEDDEEADLGGELYTRKTTPSGASNSSDSRSRTSASLSNADSGAQYNHHHLSQTHLSVGGAESAYAQAPKKKKKSKSSKSRSSHKSSSSTSQSTSLHSPTQSFSISPAVAGAPLPHTTSPLALSSPQALEFDGFSQVNREARGFPSVGLTGTRGKARDMGVFLAHRGDA